MIHLGLGDRGGALTVGLGVVEFRSYAVSEADFVVLSHFAVDFLHRESVIYFCHS